MSLFHRTHAPIPSCIPPDARCSTSTFQSPPLSLSLSLSLSLPPGDRRPRASPRCHACAPPPLYARAELLAAPIHAGHGGSVEDWGLLPQPYARCSSILWPFTGDDHPPGSSALAFSFPFLLCETELSNPNVRYLLSTSDLCRICSGGKPTNHGVQEVGAAWICSPWMLGAGPGGG